MSDKLLQGLNLMGNTCYMRVKIKFASKTGKQIVSVLMFPTFSFGYKIIVVKYI